MQADFDKNAPYHVRDNGIVSVTLLRAVLRLLLKTAVTTPHLMSGLTLLESMVHRAVKKGGAKGLTGILVTDVEVRLFSIHKCTATATVLCIMFLPP